jgi:predicted RNase H-like nuclease
VRVIGVDGCRGGWLAATLEPAGDVAWTWTADIGAVLAVTADAVAVDIPIGLPDAGSRACDREARAALGRRGVSVFPAPVRAVLTCATYTEARAVLAATGGPSMSAQAFGIVTAVRQVDEVITPADEPRVLEAHPELAFCLMGGGPGLAGKRTTAGAATRLRLLTAWRPDVLDVLARAPQPAGLDDALDALACAWVARRWLRGQACVLGDGSRDRRGLLMRIAG